MSRMSECAQDLESIHNILLGQRKVASDNAKSANGPLAKAAFYQRVEVIDDLLLEFEAAGVVWPGNVVSLEERITKHVGPPKVVAPELSPVDRWKLSHGCPII